MFNPLLLIRIVSSSTENCLNIVFAEAEYDGKLFSQLIRCSICRDTLVMLIWDEFSQMFGIFRFHPWSEWWTDGFSTSFVKGRNERLLRSFCLACFSITQKIITRSATECTSRGVIRQQTCVNCYCGDCVAIQVASTREENHTISVARGKNRQEHCLIIY